MSQQRQTQRSAPPPPPPPVASQRAAIQARDEVPPVVRIMNEFKVQIAQSLPKHFPGDRMMRLCMNELRRQPKLQACDPYSFLGAVITASQMGLEIGSHLGHAYLVPFKQECSLITGYKGMIDLARRSDRIKGVKLEKIIEGDAWHYGIKDSQEVFNWQPGAGDRSDAKLITHFFSHVSFDHGRGETVVMSRAEIDAVRDGRRTKDMSFWGPHYAEMGKKTVGRRHFKTLPQSPELQKISEMEDRHEDGQYQNNHMIMAQIGAIGRDFKEHLPDPEADAPMEVMREQARDPANARAEFDRAFDEVKKYGVPNPLSIIKATADAVTKADANTLNAWADELDNWLEMERTHESEPS